MAFSLASIVIPSSGQLITPTHPAGKWLSRHKRLRHNVDEIVRDRQERELAIKATLYKSWLANVYEPLGAHIRQKMSDNTKVQWNSRRKLYQVFLDYCNDPYSVLSLVRPSDKYDPYAVIRNRSFCVHHPHLRDPLNLAARERKTEHLVMHPEWPVFRKHPPKISLSRVNAYKPNC